MKVTLDKTENCQAYLTIELEPDEMTDSMDAAFKRLGKEARVPGFRKGKAPRDLLERYLGRERVLEEAINDRLPKAYDEAVKEQGLDVVAQPEIELTQTEPVTFTAVAPLRPKVTIGDYKGIQVERNEEKITDKQIDDVVEHLRHQYATWEPADRPIQLNDMAIFDVESTVEGKPFIVQQNAQYQVLAGQAFPAPGFAMQLVGLRSGDEKEFKLTLPEDAAQAEYSGKEVTFKVKVTDVKQEVLPEADDEFAKTVNPEFDTLKALRESAMKDMKERAAERARLDFEERVVDAVVELSEVEFPPVMVESEINRIINQSFQSNQQNLEDYLNNMKKTVEELREEVRPSATRSITRSLVLGQVSEDNKIEADEAEIDEEIESMTASAAPEKKPELVKALNDPQMRHSIEHTIIARKTMKHLTDTAEANKPAKKTRSRSKKAADNAETDNADKEEK